MIPVVEVFFCSFYESQFLFGVIDKRTELALLIVSEGGPEELVYLAFDISRRVFQHMLECRMLSMDIGKEVLCTFREVQYCLQVYDFSTGIGNRGERL